MLDLCEVVACTGVAFDRKGVVDRLSCERDTVVLASSVDEAIRTTDAVLDKDDIEVEDEADTAEDAGALELGEVEVLLIWSDVEDVLSMLVDEEGVLLVVCTDVEVELSMLFEDVVVDAELESGAALAVTNSHTINAASQVARRAQIDILTDARIRG